MNYPSGLSVAALRGRRALVTGAAGDIGAAIATALHAAGASVAVSDVDLEGAERQLAAMGSERAIALELDVRSSQSANAAIETAAQRLGGLDILVNNAGIARDAKLEQLTDEDWDAVLEIDLRGYFYCARSATEHLRLGGHGRIVNISSRAHLGNPGQANYSAAKAGVIGFTRATQPRARSRPDHRERGRARHDRHRAGAQPSQS